MRASSSKDRFMTIGTHDNVNEYMPAATEDGNASAEAGPELRVADASNVPDGLAELHTPDGTFLIRDRRSRPRDPAHQKKIETPARSYSGSPQMMALGGLIIIGVLVGSYTTKYDAAIGHVHGALAVPAVGFLALQLFLARAALRLYDDVKSFKTLTDFVISRLFRYAPAAVPAVLFGFVTINAIGVPGLQAHLASLPANLFMMADIVGAADIDSSHWRLKIEIIQAVLVAAAWFGPMRKNLAALLTVALAINACSVDGEPVRHNLLTLHGLMTNDGYLPLFVFGVSLYHLTLDRTALVWRVMLCAAAILAFLSNTPIHGAFVVGSLAVLTAIALGSLQWLGRWRWLSLLGEIAFPIYVVHFVMGFAIIHRLETLGCPPFVAMAIASAAAIFVGKLLNGFVERPLQLHGPVAIKDFTAAAVRIARRARATQQALPSALQQAAQ